MRGTALGCRLVAAALAAVACATAGSFLCADDSDCTLAGMPGACFDGHCGYPNDDCDSGYVYPQGAGSMAGECVDMELPGEGTAGSDDDDDVADDDDDDGDDDDDDDDDDESGDPIDCPAGQALTLEATADTFFLSGCEGPRCTQLNFGAADTMDVGSLDGGDVAVIVLRFADALDVEEFNTASLQLDMTTGDLVDVVIRARSLDDIAWVEGTKNGEGAEPGDSNWQFADVPVLPWPAGGPPSAARELLGAAMLDTATDEVLELTLDASLLQGELADGHDSIIVDMPGNDVFTTSFETRESGSPARLVLGCD